MEIRTQSRYIWRLEHRVDTSWRLEHGVDANGTGNTYRLLNKLGKGFTYHYILW